MPLAAPPTGRQVRWFTYAAVLAVVVWTGFGLTLTSGLSPDVRSDVGTVGLAVCGVLVVLSGLLRSAWSRGRRRRTWAALTAAASLALIGNLLAALESDGDTRSWGTLANDGLIAAALVVSIVVLTRFPGVRSRGVDLVVMVLDGVIMSTAVLLTASTLLYTGLLEVTRNAGGPGPLVIPLLDVVLAAVALIQLRRSGGGDRLALGLLAGGFVAYAVTDLAYATRVSGGGEDFTLGTPLDLGWIGGYLLVALAGWYPTSVWGEAPRHSPAPVAVSRGAWDTAVVFAVLLVATLAEVLGRSEENLVSVRAVLWVCLIAAAAGRQLLLSRDNARLRLGLEREVEARTTELRRMVHETEVLLSSVADGIYGVDLQGRVTFVNPSAAAQLGYSADRLRGRDAHGLFHAARPDGSPYAWSECYIAEAVRDRVVSSGEDEVYVRADQTTIPVEITASPVVDDATGTVLGGVVVFRDVTERREVERVKDEFLSVVSHELRTPLTSIRGSLGLLSGGAMGPLPPPAASMVSLALQSAERLSRMINDILDLERLVSGNMAHLPVPVAAEDLLAAAVQEMAGMAEVHGLALRLDPSAGRVRVDVDRITQALTNLIANAIKFSPSGTTVVLTARECGEEVLFSVADRGRGIPPERLQAIFDRFEQVDSSDARRFGGSGLGLTIARGIIERHAGRVWADSEPGAGTTVWFSIPRDATPHDPP